MKSLLKIAVIALTALVSPVHAQVSDWPTKPIKVIVPTPPGGGYDRAMRPLAQEMASILKQPVIVENKAGAGNIIGTQAGAVAPPDGYTLTMTGMVTTIAQGMYEGAIRHRCRLFACCGNWRFRSVVSRQQPIRNRFACRPYCEGQARPRQDQLRQLWAREHRSSGHGAIAEGHRYNVDAYPVQGRRTSATRRSGWSSPGDGHPTQRLRATHPGRQA